MKKTFTLLSIFLFVISLSNVQAQILTNGGFENWITGPSGHLDPTGWDTNNGSTTQPTVVQGAPRTGTYSCSLVSVQDTFGGFVGGSILLAVQSSIRPLTFSGWWKGNFTATPTDGINITIGVADTTFSVTGTANINTPASTNLANWTYFTDSITYTSSVPANNTSISITLASNSAATNGQLDDLTMTYAVGINDIIEAHFPSAVMRPDAHGENQILYVDLLAPQSFRMDIHNIDGKRIYTRDFNLQGGHYEFSVPTENLPEGMYLCTITGNGMQRGIKFVR